MDSVFVRGWIARWTLIVSMRWVATTLPPRGAPSAIFAVSVVLFPTGGVAYLAWVLTGRGPYRYFGGGRAWPSPRGLPGGAFWRTESLPPDASV